jgi:hypothetical protein
VRKVRGDSSSKRKKEHRKRPLPNAPLLKPQSKKKRERRILVMELRNKKDIFLGFFIYNLWGRS